MWFLSVVQWIIIKITLATLALTHSSLWLLNHWMFMIQQQCVFLKFQPLVLKYRNACTGIFWQRLQEDWFFPSLVNPFMTYLIIFSNKGIIIWAWIFKMNGEYTSSIESLMLTTNHYNAILKCNSFTCFFLSVPLYHLTLPSLNIIKNEYLNKLNNKDKKNFNKVNLFFNK